MKVIIKSLKQVVYEVEVPSSDVTVLELKKNIEETHKFEHDTLKLVFNGSIIEDGKKLSDYKIEEGSIIIMMSVKAKPKNTDKAQVDTKTEEKPADKKVEQPETAANYSEQLNTLTNELGFPKAESEAAIKAAKGNLSLAVEYLQTGIPSGNSSSSTQPVGSLDDTLQNVASMIKVISQNDPSKVTQIITGLSQQSPELFELIKQNEEKFRELLMQPITEQDMQRFQTLNNQMTGGQSAGSQQAARPGQIRLTQDEAAAVKRLQEFGFSQMDAVQAFLACDKNEEYALNFLFDNKDPNSINVSSPQISGLDIGSPKVSQVAQKEEELKRKEEELKLKELELKELELLKKEQDLRAKEEALKKFEEDLKKKSGEDK